MDPVEDSTDTSNLNFPFNKKGFVIVILDIDKIL